MLHPSPIPANHGLAAVHPKPGGNPNRRCESLPKTEERSNTTRRHSGGRKAQNANPYARMAEADARRYERSRDLVSLIALWPKEAQDHSLAGTTLIVEKLEKALRAERRRGLSGHWCYDLNRHAALISALKAERERLQSLAGCRA